MDKMVSCSDENEREELRKQFAADRKELRKQSVANREGREIVPYNTGHGDFCLLPHGHNFHLEGAPTVVRPEVQGDTEPFQFMKLLPEVRFMIYKLMINPFCIDDMLHLIVNDTGKEWFCPCRENDFGECSDCNTRYPFKKHPGRNSTYTIFPDYPLPPSERYEIYEPFECEWSWEKAQAADDLRNLSNSNSRVREELAVEMWRKTTVYVDTAHLDAFEEFLLDRPAIWSGIKQIRLHLNLEDVDLKLVADKAFKEGCKRIGAISRPERLELELLIHETGVVDIANKVLGGSDWSGEGYQNLAEGISAFHVTREFVLDIRPTVGELTMLPLEPKLRDHAHQVEQHKSRIEEWILPESLRQKKEKTSEEMTEQEKYMATRV